MAARGMLPATASSSWLRLLASSFVPERSGWFPAPGPICVCGSRHRNSNPRHSVRAATQERIQPLSDAAASHCRLRPSTASGSRDTGTWTCARYRQGPGRSAAPALGTLRSRAPASHGSRKQVAGPCWCRWFRHSETARPCEPSCCASHREPLLRPPLQGFSIDCTPRSVEHRNASAGICSPHDRGARRYAARLYWHGPNEQFSQGTRSVSLRNRST